MNKKLLFYIIFLAIGFVAFLVTAKSAKKENASKLATFVGKLCITESQCNIVDDCCGINQKSLSIFAGTSDSHAKDCRKALAKGTIKCPGGIVNPIPVEPRCHQYQCRLYNIVTEEYWD